MNTLLAGLATLAGPMVARVLMALGFAVVTIGGVAVGISTLKAEIIAGLGTAPVAALQIAGLAGAWIGIGLIFGAMSWCVAFWTLTKAQSIIGSAT